MQDALLAVVRERVRNGEVSESRLARMTGVSQPHIHNVLKGVRSLSTELADEIIRQLNVSSSDVFGASFEAEFPSGEQKLARVGQLAGLLGPGMTAFEPERLGGFTLLPVSLTASLERPLTATLARDNECAPRFEAGDMVLINRDYAARTATDKHGVYVVMTLGGPRVRFVRRGATRVYLPSEQNVRQPGRWEAVPLGPQGLKEIVRGRIVWVSRQLEEAERTA